MTAYLSQEQTTVSLITQPFPLAKNINIRHRKWLSSYEWIKLLCRMLNHLTISVLDADLVC